MTLRNKTFTKLSLCTLAVLALLSFSSCGETASDAGADAEKMMDDAADKGKEMMDDAADKAKDMAGDAADAAEAGKDAVVDKMDKLGADLSFEAGSMEASIQEFMQTGSGTKTFKLDKIPFEGEEISVEANKQLDNLALIMSTYPALKAEVQCHTPEADNKLGAAAKKTASGVRALWVKAKLKSRGVDGDRLEANGYGDTELLEGVDGKDDSQKRIEIALTK